MEEISKHPYDAFIPPNADKLIIGTIPPYRFCHRDKESLFAFDVDFYYGSKDNYFWRLLSEIFDVKLSFENSDCAVEERKQLLVDINAGITDIVDSCIHINKRSDDASLGSIKQKDIAKLLAVNPNINRLIYTSRFVAKQMNESVRRYCKREARHKWKPGKLDGSLKINGREYGVSILYSPSPNALRGVTAEKRLKRYMDVFDGVFFNKNIKP